MLLCSNCSLKAKIFKNGQSLFWGDGIRLIPALAPALAPLDASQSYNKKVFQNIAIPCRSQTFYLYIWELEFGQQQVGSHVAVFDLFVNF